MKDDFKIYQRLKQSRFERIICFYFILDKERLKRSNMKMKAKEGGELLHKYERDRKRYHTKCKQIPIEREREITTF